jgi:hypothetical protein
MTLERWSSDSLTAVGRLLTMAAVVSVTAQALCAQPSACKAGSPDADAVLASVRSTVTTPGRPLRAYLDSLGMPAVMASEVQRMTTDSLCVRAQQAIDNAGWRPNIGGAVQLIRVSSWWVVDGLTAAAGRGKPVAVLDSNWTVRGEFGVASVPFVDDRLPPFD